MKYCYCRKPSDKRFMIQCELFEECFHGDCVNLTRNKVPETRYCKPCAVIIWKQKEVTTQLSVLASKVEALSKQDKDKVITELRDEMTELKESVTSSQGEVDTAHVKMKDKDKVITKLQGEMAELKKRLRSSEEEVDIAHAQMRDKDKVIVEIQDEMTELKKCLKSFEEEVDIAHAKMKDKVITELQDEMTALRKWLRSSEGEVVKQSAKGQEDSQKNSKMRESSSQPSQGLVQRRCLSLSKHNKKNIVAAQKKQVEEDDDFIFKRIKKDRC